MIIQNRVARDWLEIGLSQNTFFLYKLKIVVMADIHKPLVFAWSLPLGAFKNHPAPLAKQSFGRASKMPQALLPGESFYEIISDLQT